METIEGATDCHPQLHLADVTVALAAAWSSAQLTLRRCCAVRVWVVGLGVQLEFIYHSDTKSAGQSWNSKAHLTQEDVLKALADPTIPGIPAATPVEAPQPAPAAPSDTEGGGGAAPE